MPQALRLRGRLDLQALQRAVDTIVERHESLRTHFAQIDGEPVQIIEPPRAFGTVRLRISADCARKSNAVARLKSCAGKWEEPFNLDRPRSTHEAHESERK